VHEVVVTATVAVDMLVVLVRSKSRLGLWDHLLYQDHLANKTEVVVMKVFVAPEVHLSQLAATALRVEMNRLPVIANLPRHLPKSKLLPTLRLSAMLQSPVSILPKLRSQERIRVRDLPRGTLDVVVVVL
jgi:hypothetical protein